MRVLLILLLLAGSANSVTPVGFKKWHNGGKSYSQQLGGAVRNFEKSDRSWGKINNNWKFDGDSAYIDESVLKVKLDTLTGVSSATLKWDGQDYTIAQSLMGIGWLKMSTKGRQWIDNTMNWGNFSTDSNIANWTGVSPAVDYRVKKVNGVILNSLFFKKAFLDSAVTLYNQRTDSLDIALANVMVYTLSSNIDNADSGLGNITKRQLKSFGKYTFDIGQEYLQYPGSDTLSVVPIGQFWRKRNDSIFCIEYVMMSQVKRVHEEYPNATIWHNATTKISGVTNVEDTDVYNSASAYGARPFPIRIDDDANIHILIRAKNLSTELPAGATMTAAICSLYQYDGGRPGHAGGDVEAFRVFKPWVEGTLNNEICGSDNGSTQTDWSCTTNEWRTSAIACADDDGVDNSSTDPGACDADGTTADRKATRESIVTTIDADNDEWYGWTISNALAQGWYDGSFNEEGIVLIADDVAQVDILVYGTEHTEKQPFFVFTYTVASTGQRIMIRK